MAETYAHMGAYFGWTTLSAANAVDQQGAAEIVHELQKALAPYRYCRRAMKGVTSRFLQTVKAAARSLHQHVALVQVSLSIECQADFVVL